MNQLSLFAAAPVERPRVSYRDTVRALMGAEFDSFVEWCRTGNREMCAAVLWRSGAIGRKMAEAAVEELAGQ